jgi:hypothetical protein
VIRGGPETLGQVILMEVERDAHLLQRVLPQERVHRRGLDG